MDHAIKKRSGIVQKKVEKYQELEKQKADPDDVFKDLGIKKS